MLAIRSDQMKVFEEAAMKGFEDEMVVHSRGFTPELCKVLGEEQLRVAIRRAISRAGSYGFTYRGPIRLYMEMMYLFGSDFDTDPQYPRLAKILAAPDEQMQRAELLNEAVLDFQEKVCGSEAANVRRALGDLRILAQRPTTFPMSALVPGMLLEMRRNYPEIVTYVGEDELTALIQEGEAEARKHGFPVRGAVLVVSLMFAFGHGCVSDPLYPWISRTLEDERIADSQARSERLEKKALTWLEHVLDGPKAGVKL